MLKEIPLDFLNKTISKTLSLDTDLQEHLKPLHNKILAIDIQGLNKTVYCVFSKNGVRLKNTIETEANTTISGGPFSLLNILLTKNLNISGVKIEGEIDTAQQAKTLAENLDIDWEELLAGKIGNSPAYHISKVGRKIKNYFTDQRENFQENLGDYLKDEKKLLIVPEQAKQLYDNIDQCRFQADRLQARIKQLKIEISQ